MSVIPTADVSKTPLGIHRILSPRCGLRVSPLCFGAMSIGEAHSNFMGMITKNEAFKLLDTYYESGGNFIDTVNMYQDEQSEVWLRERMEHRGIRDMATKYTVSHKQHSIVQTEHGIGSNYGGNRKSLHISLRDSLLKHRTDYVNILYVHWHDFITSVEEIMQSLNNFVRSGKVIYLGISDCPAWVIVKANAYAKNIGLTPLRDLSRALERHGW
jgi:aryl-alcohol dehydrogenase-like predicted oxidoreductase